MFADALNLCSSSLTGRSFVVIAMDYPQFTSQAITPMCTVFKNTCMQQAFVTDSCLQARAGQIFVAQDRHARTHRSRIPRSTPRPTCPNKESCSSVVFPCCLEKTGSTSSPGTHSKHPPTSASSVSLLLVKCRHQVCPSSECMKCLPPRPMQSEFREASPTLTETILFPMFFVSTLQCTQNEENLQNVQPATCLTNQFYNRREECCTRKTSNEGRLSVGNARRENPRDPIVIQSCRK